MPSFLTCATFPHIGNQVFGTVCKAEFHLTGTDRIGTKEDIPLVEILMVTYHHMNVLFNFFS